MYAVFDFLFLNNITLLMKKMGTYENLENEVVLTDYDKAIVAEYTESIRLSLCRYM